MEMQTKSLLSLLSGLSRRAAKPTAAPCMRILGIALLLFNLVAAAIPVQAAPSSTPDQQQSSATASSDGNNAGSTWQQGIRAGITGQLVGVEVYVQTPGSAQFFVKTGGPPWQTGTAVFSATISPAATGWYYIDISAADIVLGAEENFVIGIQGSGGGLWFGSDASDVYTRGALYLNAAPQTGDMAFRTHMEPLSGTLDQQQLVQTGFYNTGNFVWQQGIRAGMAGKLVGVEIYVSTVGSARFFVKTGAPWQSGADAFSAIISPSATGWYYVDLSSATITLDEEQDLVIGFQGISGGLQIGGDSGNPYPRGQLYLDYGYGPQVWDGDLAFRTHMVGPLEPNLSIVKHVAPANAYPGDTITYTLTFSNAGGELASGVIITDSIPISVTGTIVSSSGVAITQTAPGYVWTVEDLDPNVGGVITITGVLSPSLPRGPIANTAAIAGTRSSAESSASVTVIHRPPTVNIAPLVPFASNLATAISLNDPQGDLLSGTLEILSGAGTPVRVTFETLSTDCSGGAGAPLQLKLNGAWIGETYAPANCSCTPGVGTVDFTGPEIAANFVNSSNTWAFNQANGEPSTAWARATIRYGDGRTQNACLFDHNGGSCTVTDLCSAGFNTGPLSGSSVLPSLTSVAVSESYSNSELPFWLDVADLAAGDYRLHVTASDGVDSGEDEAAFTLDGERKLYISPVLILAKNVAPASALPGATITYTLSFSNVSGSLLTGVVITDTLPVSVTNTGVISSGVSITQVGDSRYVWKVGALAPHSGGVITVTGTLSEPLVSGAIVNTATIAAQGQVYDVSYIALDVLNVPPLAGDDSGDVAEDSSDNVLDVLANDSDAINGDSLSVFAVGHPSHGTAVDNDANVLYTPAADFFGTDVFTYTASDGHGGYATAAITVTVSSVNDPPTANDDARSVAKDSSDNALDVLANDSFAPDTGETLSVLAVGDPPHGTASNGTTVIHYTPEVGFSGTDVFTYTASDGNSGIATATVTVRVLGESDLLIVKRSDPASAAPGQAITYTLTFSNAGPDTALGVVITDSLPISITGASVISSSDVPLIPRSGATYAWDVAGDLLPAEGGVITITGRLVEPLAAGSFANTASITSAVSDSAGSNNTSSASISVQNVAPLAADDAYSIDEDSGEHTLNVLVNDSDTNSDDVSLHAVGTPLHGSATIAQPSVRYTPAANFNGSEVFTYTVTDGGGNYASATITVTVNAINDPPVAVDDAYVTSKNTPLTVIAAGGVLVNDSDADGDPLSVILQSGPDNGTLQLGPDGAFVYTPTTNFSGTDSFTYRLTDGTLLPIGYWAFDDGADPTADGSGQGHAGDLINAPTFVTTLPPSLTTGLALNFDGANDYVSIGGPESDFDLNVLSVAFWVKVDTFNTAWQALVTKGDSAWRVHRYSSTNNVSFDTNGLSNGTLASNRAINDGQWHHIAAVFDGSTKYLYIDGVLDNSAAASGSISLNDYPVLIGENAQATNRYFDGLLDDVRIYNQALSADEVVAAMTGLLGSDWATVTLTVSDIASVTPTLTAPAHQTITDTTSLTLTWDGVPGATGYSVDFNGTLVDVGNTTAFNTGVLAAGAYTWTVAAYDTHDTSNFAAPWAFAVTGAPVSVTLTDPVTETEIVFGGGICGSIWFTDTGVLPTSLTITYTYNFPSVDQNGLLGQYRITAEGGAGYLAALSLCYDDSDLLVAGISSPETALHAYHYVGSGVWQEHSEVDPLNNLITAHNLADLGGVWGLGVAGDAPTAVRLRTLRSVTSFSRLGLIGGLGLLAAAAVILGRKRR